MFTLYQINNGEFIEVSKSEKFAVIMDELDNIPKEHTAKITSEKGEWVREAGKPIKFTPIKQ